jgi:hypothetical protein
MQRIIFRKGLDAQLANTILEVGSPGWVTDTKCLAVGDGSNSPPRIITTKSTGSFSFLNLDKLTMPGNLAFDSLKPGAIGSITPARMTYTKGLLAFRGLDSNGQDTWGNPVIMSSDQTLTIVNGDGSANNIDARINLNSDLLKNLIRNTITINAGGVTGLNELIIQILNSLISANDTVHYGVDVSQSANTITVASFDNPITSLPAGTTLAILVKGRNTGPTVANLGSQLGNGIPVVRTDGSPLKESDLVPGVVYFAARPDGKLGIVNFNPSQSPSRNSLSFLSSTTWTVPDGCYFIFARVWGGGGAGGSSAGSNSNTGVAGSGGGGGGYAEGFYLVTPGQQIPITVGRGGTPNAGEAGNPGGTTSVGNYLFATGGNFGFGGVNGVQGIYAGTGGSSGGGQLNADGITGGFGYSMVTVLGQPANAVSGIGGSSPFGGGAPALNIGTSGANGNFPGGGGNGGAGGETGLGGGMGGAGGNGVAIITF